MTTDKDSVTERPCVSVSWTDEHGNQRSVTVSGPQGFVKFWIDKLATSALEKPIPISRPSE